MPETTYLVDVVGSPIRCAILLDRESVCLYENRAVEWTERLRVARLPIGILYADVLCKLPLAHEGFPYKVPRVNYGLIAFCVFPLS